MEPKYQIGDTVILVTDVDKLKRVVTGYTIRQSGIVYLLSCGAGNETIHFDFEIVHEKNMPRAGFKTIEQ